MKEKSEVKIFLAYAHEDKVRVIELYNKLKKEGYSPWLDKMDLMPGRQWKTEIPKALKKSDIFIACLSETSVKKQGYVQSEYRLALRQAADMPAEAIYIIPLKFDDCRIPELEQADYGVKLRDFHWLDYWEEGAFERLVAAIEYRRGELEVLEKEGRQEKKSDIAQQYQAVEAQEETKSFQEGTALEVWRKKLAHFQEQEAITANAAERFELGERIKECREKIKELENAEKKTEPINSNETNLRRYREQIQMYLEDHQLSNLEKVQLEQKRKNWGITEAEARQILVEELAPILKAREEYQEILVELIKVEYPFDEETQQELEKIKQEKKLKEWEIREIEQPILRKAEFERKLKTFSFEIVKVDKKGEIIKRESRSARYFSEDLGNGISLEMVYISEGEFWMGTEDEEIERLVKKYDSEWFRCEKPRHQVTVPSFYMGKYPITQAQWKAIASLPKIDTDLILEPSNFQGENRPVERVSWYDGVEYCKRLSKRTGKDYRLPSEAEWECATRAGTNTPFYFGETLTTDLANYDGNYTYAEENKGEYRQQTIPVGEFPPNAFGLYDLHGNVWEWCLDAWHDNYDGAPKNGSAWIDNDNRSRVKCLRGSSWYTYSRYCRSACRFRDTPSLDVDFVGFRVVLVGAGV